MRKTIVKVGVGLAALWTVAALAAPSVGVIDMRQLVQDSPQLKQSSTELTKKFSGQRDKLVSMQKSLQDDLKKFQKNQSVMSKKDLDALKKQIESEGTQLRLAQAQFQQDIYKAQGDMMEAYMGKVKSAAQAVAEKEKLDLVLPVQAVLYAKDQQDITSKVADKLK